MSQRVIIEVTPWSYRFQLNKQGYIPGTPVTLHKHLWAFNESEWNNQLKVYEIKKRYRHWDRKTETIYLPRYDLDRFLKLLDHHDVQYVIRERKLSAGVPVDFEVADWYKPLDELQEHALDYIEHDDSPVRGLALQPGKGKSSISLVGASRIGRRFMIKTPILLQQWKGVISKFLKVNEEDVYVISGASSIARLWAECDKTIHPKIIIAAVQTLRNYAQGVGEFEHFPPADKFIERCGIGTIISDEVHMHFHTTLILDMIFNPSVTIPMTATFETTSKLVEPILNGHFPLSIRFGHDKYEKYVNVSSYAYTISLSHIPKNEFKTFKGYSHVKFEQHFLKKRPVLDRLIDDVYYSVLHAEYFNYALPGERLLIICSTTEMCAYLKKRLCRDYPDYKTDIFVAGSPESVKVDNDIVIATVKGAGVGFDMPNLISCLVTVAADSPPLNKQLLGRLRKVAGREPRLSYLSCQMIGSHVKYMSTRRIVFPPLAKAFAHHAI